MQYSNYKESMNHIVRLNDFRSNSMWGQLRGDEYIVVSYSTPIAYIKADCSQAFINVRKYSVTTSKQQTYVKQAIKELRYKHPEMQVIEYSDYAQIAEVK